jgi:hypothetical protein
MKTATNMAVVIIVLALAGQVWGAFDIVIGQNGPVTFQGTVSVDEAHGTGAVCYGDYYVTVDIKVILEDPNSMLAGMDSVQVCYKTAMDLVSTESVEVSGYYWGGTCPKQYCGRVQVAEAPDYIKRIAGYDDDWMVEGDLMYSIPSGNVGIGTNRPSEKLHVVGNVLVQGASPAWLMLRSALGDDAGISLTASGMGVNMWKILRGGASQDLVIKESFPYPPFGGDRVVVKAGSGNVGIGTSAPSEKLHVLGAALIEGQGDGEFDEALRVVKERAGRQLLAYFSNPSDNKDAAVDIQLGGGKMLPWGWSLLADSGTFIISGIANTPVVYVRNTGYVGIGVASPGYRLDLPNTAGAAGRGRANRWDTYSSQRWKTNIRTIDHAMDKVRGLRGVYFDWKEQGTHDMGMIAEEVGRVVPEVVNYEANGTDATSMAYDRLVAVLVEALKEQDARIAELEETIAQNKRLEQRLDTLERLVQRQTVPAAEDGLRP